MPVVLFFLFLVWIGNGTIDGTMVWYSFLVLIVCSAFVANKS